MARNIVNLVACAAAILLLSTTTALAQTGEWDREPNPPKPLCGVGRALPYCQTVLLLELTVFNGIESHAAPEPYYRDDSGSATIAMGLVYNTSEKNAFGALIGSHGNHPYAGAAVTGRYRRWLHSHVSADFDAGLMIPKDEVVGGGAVGMSAGVSLGLADVIGVSTRVDVFDAGSGTETAGVVGVKLGAVPLIALASLFRR